MENYTILEKFENPRRESQVRNFRTKVPKILDLKSSSEQIFRKLTLGAPARTTNLHITKACTNILNWFKEIICYHVTALRSDHAACSVLYFYI